MRISVIVPAYREEGLLEQGLLSIRSQSFSDYELIVVVRPAGDRTEEVAKRYADHVLIQRDKGLGPARNLGASVAEGDIFLFIDADTLIPRDFLKRVSQLFEDERVLSVVPRFYVYDRSYRGALSQCLLSLLTRIINKMKFLLYGMMIIVRRDVFQSLGGFRDVFGEDVDLSLRMGRKYRFNRKLVRYVSSLVAYTSSRRIQKLGILRAVHLWTYNLMRYWMLGEQFVGYLG